MDVKTGKSKEHRGADKSSLIDASIARQRAFEFNPVAEAQEMLSSFGSVGGQAFDVTLTNEAGEKAGFKANKSVEAFTSDLSALLAECREKRLNVIVRPIHRRNLPLVQLDDLALAQVERVEQISFLVIETSPGSFQAWIAASDAGADAIRRLKKGVGADINASGATRIAGSYNFKPKYAPNYPAVRLHLVAPGRTVEVVELESAGLLAPKESDPYRPPYAPTVRERRHSLVWPSYERCLADAPPARNHEGKDRSHADFEFCLIAADRGWPIEQVARQLLAVSEKAKGSGYRYARYTAERAAFIVARRKG